MSAATNWGIFQTPLNYPLWEQIGTGQLTEINATALVAYQRYQIVTQGTTDFLTNGALSNNVGTQATALGAGTGTNLGPLINTPTYAPWTQEQAANSPGIWGAMGTEERAAPPVSAQAACWSRAATGTRRRGGLCRMRWRMRRRCAQWPALSADNGHHTHTA